VTSIVVLPRHVAERPAATNRRTAMSPTQTAPQPATTLNGLDTEKMVATVNALKANPTLARFEFRVAQPLDFGRPEPLDGQRLLCGGGGGCLPAGGVRIHER
jgi:hypothetical protein